MNGKKRFFTLCILLMCCLCMTGCQLNSGVNEELDANKRLTIERGKLKVGAQIFYAPMEYEDEKGNVVGFDMDLIRAMGEEMKLEVEIVQTTWDSIFTDLEKGKYDVIVSSMSKTRERDEKYALTTCYMDNSLVLVVPNDSNISDIKDLQGKNVGVHMGATADYYLEKQIDNGISMNLGKYETVYYAFEQLKKGNLDAVLSDDIVVAYYLQQEAEKYRIAWKAEEREPFAMCLKKDKEELRDALNRAYENVEKNGTVDKLKEKYLINDM